MFPRIIQWFCPKCSKAVSSSNEGVGTGGTGGSGGSSNGGSGTGGTGGTASSSGGVGTGGTGGSGGSRNGGVGTGGTGGTDGGGGSSAREREGAAEGSVEQSVAAGGKKRRGGGGGGSAGGKGKKKAKKASTKGKRSAFQYLFDKLTPEQRDQIAVSLKITEDTRALRTELKPDYRGMTYREVCMGVLDLANGNFPEKLYDTKSEKDSGWLYGIQVKCAGVAGTEVRSLDGVKGRVAGVKVVEGVSSYTIAWEDGKDFTYSTFDILRDAVEGQGVVSLAEDKERFGIFLCAVLCLVCVHVYMFVCEDDNKEDPKPGCELKDDARKNEAKTIRDKAWAVISGKSVKETLTKRELGLLAADKGLHERCLEEGSFAEMLDLSKDRTGLMKDTHMGFDKSHQGFVGHFVRGAQASWKMGRCTSVRSCITPFAAGVRGELPTGVSLKEAEKFRTSVHVPEGELDQHGLSTRAILAPAWNGKSGEERRYEWYKHAPTYKHLVFSRPKKLGELAATTENTAKVAPTRKHLAFYTVISDGSRTSHRDQLIQVRTRV